MIDIDSVPTWYLSSVNKTPAGIRFTQYNGARTTKLSNIITKYLKAVKYFSFPNYFFHEFLSFINTFNPFNILKRLFSS